MKKNTKLFSVSVIGFVLGFIASYIYDYLCYCNLRETEAADYSAGNADTTPIKMGFTP